jgi:hypothetical protein
MADQIESGATPSGEGDRSRAWVPPRLTVLGTLDSSTGASGGEGEDQSGSTTMNAVSA